MFAFVFLSGLLIFAFWDWWVLQRAVLSFLKCRRPWVIRVSLLMDLLVLFLVPGVVLRHAAFSSPMAARILTMGFVVEVIGLWFGVMAFLLELWNFFGKKEWHLSPLKVVVVSLAFCVFAITLGYYQAMHPSVKQYDIALPTVPADADGYRILLLSDLHIKLFYPESILEAVDKAVEEHHPDLILHAGDFIDKASGPELDDVIRQRIQWRAPDGFYGVLGNHDGYAGWRSSLAFHGQTPMTILGGRTDTNRVHPQAWLALTGIDDPWIYRRAPWGPKDAFEEGDVAFNTSKEAFEYLRKKLPSPEENACNIVLAHDPSWARALPEGYDIAFCGHTHGGQLFPFNFVVNFSNKFRASIWHSLRTGLRLYICRGTGFWGPPLRFLVPSEITLITLHHQPVEAGE